MFGIKCLRIYYGYDLYMYVKELAVHKLPLHECHNASEIILNHMGKIV